ncbi:class I adenylate-forming enzyme family protein [Longirhabdus pacifica]|uniref:class I adenylate-forming enzyme family protein n=1 Tax=Longirhabdus pacifica TaxID=2305227 RepID=UPI0013E89ECA|nr:class I adenylate-forming enzyme family protein [Longirhabdus pacifica]
MKLTQFFEQYATEKAGVFTHNSDHKPPSFQSYYSILHQAKKQSERWKAYHVKPKFIAVIWMDQSVEMIQTILSVIYASGIPVPLHANMKESEVAAVISQTEADIVMLSTNKISLVQPSFSSCMYVDATMNKVIHDQRRVRTYHPPPETSMIFMSSGSTGKAKGIMLSDHNMIANAIAIQQYVRLDDKDQILLFKSLAYCSSWSGEWLVALLSGANTLLRKPFVHALEMVQFIKHHHPTFLCTIPSLLIAMNKINWKPEDLQSLRKMVIAGGKMPATMLEEYVEKLPHIQFYPSYGLTEAAPRVSYLPPDMVKDNPSSVGFPVAGVQVKIMAEGKELHSNTEGEIVVAGSNVMQGYYHDPQLTDSTLQNGWLHTSDIGYKDERGLLYVTGRKDHRLNVSGHAIYPETIENILLNQSLVKEVAIVGEQHEVWGQQIIALIVPEETRVTQEDLFSLFRTCLQPILRPKKIRLLSSLPKTSLGKIDRKKLLQIVEGDEDGK